VKRALLLAACGAPAATAPVTHAPVHHAPAASGDPDASDHLALAYRALAVDTIDPAPARDLALLADPGGSFTDDEGANEKLLRAHPLAAGDEWAIIEKMAMSRDNVHTALLDAGAAANLGALGQDTPARAPGFRAHRAGDGSVVIDASWGDAAAAGLAAGDVLTTIDGASPPRVIALPFLLHPDHTFALALTRAGASVSASLTMTVQMQRALDVRTVRHCAVIAMSELTRDTTQALRDEVGKLDPRGVRGIVLDLRGDLGGADPLPVISLFTGADPLLGAIDLAGAHTPWKRDGDRVDWPHPVAILVDEQTASAAEMIAFSLGRLGDARVFGAPTAGALSVPDATPLGDHVLMVPTARVVDPIDGTPARGDRVEPDVVIGDASAAQVIAGEDLQLDRAIDWVLTKK